jgi:integrase
MAKVAFTAGRVSGFKCPTDRAQAFLWDATAQGLGLRATPAGKPAYIFQGVFGGKDIRLTIGSPSAWSIPQAQAKARELQRLIDEGTDPRSLKAEKLAATQAQQQRQQAEHDRQNVTGLAAWADYIAASKAATKPGHPDKPKWGTRTLADHTNLSAPGGVAYKRKSMGTTQPGPLYNLLNQPLVQINSNAVAAWLKAENTSRPTQAALAFRLLRAFLNWCAEHPTYSAIANPQAHSTKAVRNHVAKQTPKTDALQREHLPAWFAGVLSDTNPHARAYLVGLLTTGARANELAALRWEDVSLKFGGSLTLHDKVEGLRVIPCPAYLAHLLAALPRRGPWVFGVDSERPNVDDTAAYNNRKALAAGGLPHVSLHGLRRSFKSLAEWVECPAGIVAQIMGHKPSATAEKHYTVRPVDLLRLWHDKIEAWMLEQAGVTFDRKAEPGKLALVG